MQPSQCAKMGVLVSPWLRSASLHSHVSHTNRIEGRAGRLRRPPDHAGAAPVIRNGLLGYLVGSLISEGSGEDEDDLVLRGAAPLEDVLQHVRQPHSRE